MSKALSLELLGVREHNLKDLSLAIRHDQFVVVTGVSGSGKSTLAFDTIYAEGGRRYIETFSPYTRQFLDRLHQPELDSASGLRPALALEQRNRTTSSRSTVGTITEINDYLKVIWAQLSTALCPGCGRTLVRGTPHLMAQQLLRTAADLSAPQIILTFPLVLRGRATLDSIGAALQSQGLVRYFSTATGAVRRLEELGAEESGAAELLIVVDRIMLREGEEPAQRITATLAQCYHLGHGRAKALFPLTEGFHLLPLREELSCPFCETTLPLPKQAIFSFNSPLGACSECHGFGKVLEIDPRLCVPDESRSIEEGAIVCWTSATRRRELGKLKTFCSEQGIDTALPWGELSPANRQLLFYGEKKARGFRGIHGWFEKLKRKRHRMHIRVLLSRYRSESPCPVCRGGRLKPEAALYRVAGRTISEIWQLPISELHAWIAARAAEHRGEEFSKIAIEEVESRLRYLREIGLEYLTLDRQTRTLSGGESQRVNLTAILGSRLVNTILVLDEPTIGLHSRDTSRLIATLERLRDRGNTLLVVEHDREVISAADELIDLGPGAGANGGEVVYQGAVDGISKQARSLTGRYLRNRSAADKRCSDPALPARQLVIRGARAHNLRSIDVSLPLGWLVAVCGVSGSGKSSLVNDCLYQNFERLAQRQPLTDTVTGLEGLNLVDDIVLVDQSPVGKTPRANPATYTGVWDIIREIFAASVDAERLGLGRSAFSFNVPGGRCPSCDGAGFHRIEMQFLADVFVECEQCGGTRFKDAVLTVRLNGRNVSDFLRLSLTEVHGFFREFGEGKQAEKIDRLLRPLLELGLGYLRLGQPLSELSGGEAQRLKLASYLETNEKKRGLFILDEPTTGLHPHNVQALLGSLRKLVEFGHSVIVVEHNLDVIRSADWMIELGPEGGEKGGRIVVAGNPVKLLADQARRGDSPTLQQLAGDMPPIRPKKRGPIRRSHDIQIVGAHEHNLRDVAVNIPQGKLTVVTGVSGSGKSTLAFDILFAEGQRRYIDCLSPFARQYITQLRRADVERVDSIPPTIAISQKTSPPHGISTLATVTEIYQYLRLLFAKVGVQHCPDHDLPIAGFSLDAIGEEIATYVGAQRAFIFAPVVSERKGYYNELFNRALRAEIEEARIDGAIVRLTPELRLERHKLHTISLLVASLTAPKAQAPILRQAVEQALLLGSGVVEVVRGKKDGAVLTLSTERVCPKCRRGFSELDPRDFSFRSSRGVCSRCGGYGRIGKEAENGRGELCPECNGARIGAVGRHVYIGGKSIHELTQFGSQELKRFLGQVRFDNRLQPIVGPILREVCHRLDVIRRVGLDYLALDRDASTISGGEAQRLRLARALGSPLSGICYVLDEPTIGLHPKDHDRLMEILEGLRDAGNTVVVVEHDEETIAHADHIIDMGPGGGKGGGKVVASGTLRDILRNKASPTGAALRERMARRGALERGMVGPEIRRSEESIELIGAGANNLRKVNAKFPLRALTVVCGVSGAGKSSLVHGSLVPAIHWTLERRSSDRVERVKYCKRQATAKSSGPEVVWGEIRNAASLKRIVEIDQTPVGKTSASTPASYLGIFDEIRKLFAALPEAKTQGVSASYFSFNTGRGRCEQCGGRGFLKIPMSFLPEATAPCEECGGLRYNPAALAILYQGLSIGEVLTKTMVEAVEIFKNHAAVHRTLEYVNALGLGYLSLGQPTHTLSGGEAQRLKIASELGTRTAVDTLYVLDEPTVGLHMTDIDKLLAVLRRLIDRGNTVVMIEHNLDLIAAADHLIELGPGPGDDGGRIVFSGSPSELLRSGKTTATKEFLRVSPEPEQAVYQSRAEDSAERP